MAYYNALVVGCWRDKRLRTLTKDEKLLFFFLLQLENVSVAGLVHTTPEKLAADSYGDWTNTEITTLLAGLQQKGLAVYDQEWLWVTGYFKYKMKAINQNGFANAKYSLQECESKLIFDAWFQKYGNVPEVVKWMKNTVFTGDSAAPPPAVPIGDLEPEPRTMHLMNDEVEAVWTHYCRAMSLKPQPRLTDKRRDKILARLRDSVHDPDTNQLRPVTVEDLMLAISNATKSDWHMGRDPKTSGMKYNSLEDHILGSFEMFEKWFGVDAEKEPTGPHPAHDAKHCDCHRCYRWRKQQEKAAAKSAGEEILE